MATPIDALVQQMIREREQEMMLMQAQKARSEAPKYLPQLKFALPQEPQDPIGSPYLDSDQAALAVSSGMPSGSPMPTGFATPAPNTRQAGPGTLGDLDAARAAWMGIPRFDDATMLQPMPAQSAPAAGPGPGVPGPAQPATMAPPPHAAAPAGPQTNSVLIPMRSGAGKMQAAQQAMVNAQNADFDRRMSGLNQPPPPPQSNPWMKAAESKFGPATTPEDPYQSMKGFARGVFGEQMKRKPSRLEQLYEERARQLGIPGLERLFWPPGEF